MLACVKAWVQFTAPGKTTGNSPPHAFPPGAPRLLSRPYRSGSRGLWAALRVEPWLQQARPVLHHCIPRPSPQRCSSEAGNASRHRPTPQREQKQEPKAERAPIILCGVTARVTHMRTGTQDGEPGKTQLCRADWLSTRLQSAPGERRPSEQVVLDKQDRRVTQPLMSCHTKCNSR